MIVTDKNFPAALPCALRDGYDINHVQPFKRTPMESGRSRSRRKFSSVPSKVDVKWLFRSAEAAAFEAWFRDVISDGADWFNMPIKSPIGMSASTCRFMEMYRGPQLVGADDWQISAVIETWERPLLPVGWGNFPGQIVGSSVLDYAVNREWPPT